MSFVVFPLLTIMFCNIMSGTLEEYFETIFIVMVTFEKLYDHAIISFYVFTSAL